MTIGRVGTLVGRPDTQRSETRMAVPSRSRKPNIAGTPLAASIKARHRRRGQRSVRGGRVGGGQAEHRPVRLRPTSAMLVVAPGASTSIHRPAGLGQSITFSKPRVPT